MSAVIMLSFFAFALLGVPLAFALGLSTIVGLSLSDLPVDMMGGRLMFSVNSFPLMAIPFFMLAGELMVHGGIVNRIIAFANTLVGSIRGGLGHVTIFTGLGLASVSGTAVADAAALGSALLRPMEKLYGRAFSSSLIAATANLGPIQPPSTAMIVYASIAGPGVAIGALFIAGVVPALLIVAFMVAYVFVIAKIRNFPLSGERFQIARVLREGWRTLPVLTMPVVVIGGIIGGAFTATEGGAIAVVMALLIGFFVTRELKLSHLPGSLLSAAITTGIVGTIIAFAATVTFLFTIDQIPQQLSALIGQWTKDPTGFLIIVFLMLIVVGMFIEPTAAYVMLVPIFAPIAVTYGIDPIHFAMVFVLTLVVGMLTPPVGTLLFVMCAMTGLTIWQIVKENWPLMLIQFGVCLLVLFFPGLVLWLPRLLGY